MEAKSMKLNCGPIQTCFLGAILLIAPMARPGFVEVHPEFMTGMVAGGQEGGLEFDKDAAWVAFYEWQIGE